MKLGGRDDFRIWVGEYRIVYAVDDAERLVLVVQIAHPARGLPAVAVYRRRLGRASGGRKSHLAHGATWAYRRGHEQACYSSRAD